MMVMLRVALAPFALAPKDALPGTVPALIVTVAYPVLFVTALAGLAEMPPATLTETVAPGTGTPASCTRIYKGSLVPTVTLSGAVIVTDGLEACANAGKRNIIANRTIAPMTPMACLQLMTDIPISRPPNKF
jgi:hypothetical protein